MSEENKDEMVLLLKTLVDKVKNLERAVYDKDNLLMKSGYVMVDSPTPHTTQQSGITGETISKMDWSEIHQMADNLG